MENRLAVNDPLPSKPVSPGLNAPKHKTRPFYQRYLAALGLAGVLIAVSLGLGIVGYHHFAGFNWIDSLLNAAMILTGMGPVGTLDTDRAKIFASAYALFSGVVFISAAGILLSPMFHRVLRIFHIDEKDIH